MDEVLHRFQTMTIFPFFGGNFNISNFMKITNDDEKVKCAIRYLSKYEKPLGIYRECKSKEKAIEIIDAANKHFSRTPWQSLVETYNRAVIYAPADSCELARAYGNRSAALYEGGSYKESVLDIERALNIGYADSTKAKLYTRKAKCLLALHKKFTPEVKETVDEARKWLEKMDAANKKYFGVILDKLSTTSSSKKPYEGVNYDKFLPQKALAENTKILRASSAIELKYSKKFGRHVVATSDIDAGATIVLQRSYASVLYPENTHKYCWNCSKRVRAGVPCRQCVNVVFCNEFCRDKAWLEHHDIECAVTPMTWSPMTTMVERMVLRLTVKAYKEAGTLEKLKDNLAKLDAIKDPIAKCLTGGIFDDTKYASVYALCKTHQIRFEDALISAMILHRLAAATEIFGKKMTDFDGLLHNQWAVFIGGLILKNCSIHMVNSIGILIDDDHGIQIKRGGTLNPFISMFNHSCDPMALQHPSGDMNAIIACQRIKKGEQIFISYRPKVWEEPAVVRRAFLSEVFHFICECTSCVQGWGPWTGLPSRTAPAYPADMVKELQRIHKKYCTNMRMVGADINDKPAIISTTFRMMNYYQLNIEYPTQEIIAVKQLIFDLYSRISF